MLFLLFLLTILGIACAGTYPIAGPMNSTLESTTCGGNCPGGCDSCPCGSSSSYQSASSWCAQYSGWSQTQCQCIMNAESGGNANAVNQNTGGSLDVGLWQINSMNWASCSSGMLFSTLFYYYLQ
jgi:hypothetical protein